MAEILCQRLKIADGKATILLKWRIDKAIPNPEFCIPTSIEIVFFSLNESPKIPPIKKPILSPIRLCKTIQKNKLYDSWSRRFKFNEKMIPIIKAIKNSEILSFFPIAIALDINISAPFT